MDTVINLSQPIIEAKLPNYNNKIYTICTKKGFYFITTDLVSRYASLYVESINNERVPSIYVAAYNMAAVNMFNQRIFGNKCDDTTYQKLALFESADIASSMTFTIPAGDKSLFILNNFLEQQNFNDPQRARPFANYACFDVANKAIVGTNGELMVTYDLFNVNTMGAERIFISKDLLVAILRYIQRFPDKPFEITVSSADVKNNVYTVMLEVDNYLFSARQSIKEYPDWKSAALRYKQPEGDFNNHLLLESEPPVLPPGEEPGMALNDILESHLHIPINTKCNPYFNKRLFWFCLKQLLLYQGSCIEYVPTEEFPVKFYKMFPEYKQTIYLMPMGQLTAEANKHREELDDISASRLI